MSIMKKHLKGALLSLKPKLVGWFYILACEGDGKRYTKIGMTKQVNWVCRYLFDRRKRVKGV